MMSGEKIVRGKVLIEELSSILRELSDSEAEQLLGTGSMNTLLIAILDPSSVNKYPNIADFLLANKYRASLLALLRRAITKNYAFKGTNKEGVQGYVSPSDIQWFEDGVMFLESDKLFEGYMGLYRNGKLSYAIAARDIRPGDKLGPEHFEFIDMDDFRKHVGQIPPREVALLDEPLQKMKSLLDSNDNDESKYQELLMNYPWVLGAQYRTIQRHTKMDDRNIPDFSGAKVHDGNRDIIEVKPPFMTLFRDNGDFTADFNNAWNQAERYLDFARENKDYLNREKGWRFDNPRCYLILGFNLTDDQLKNIRMKQRSVHSIELLTYNDLLTYMKATIDFVRKLKDEDKPVETEAA